MKEQKKNNEQKEKLSESSDSDPEAPKMSPAKISLTISSPKVDVKKEDGISEGTTNVTPPEGNSDEEQSSNEGSLIMADNPKDCKF